MIMRCARDIARATSPGPRFFHRCTGSCQHLGMLSHAKIIVAAPNSDFTGITDSVPPKRFGKLPDLPLQVSKYTVATFLMEVTKAFFKESVVKIHECSSMA